jgi:hypothetical protein
VCHHSLKVSESESYLRLVVHHIRCLFSVELDFPVVHLPRSAAHPSRVMPPATEAVLKHYSSRTNLLPRRAGNKLSPPSRVHSFASISVSSPLSSALMLSRRRNGSQTLRTLQAQLQEQGVYPIVYVTEFLPRCGAHPLYSFIYHLTRVNGAPTCTLTPRTLMMTCTIRT